MIDDRRLRRLTVASILLVLLYAGVAWVEGRLFSSPLEAAALAVPDTLLAWGRALLGLLVALSFPGILIAAALPDEEGREPVALLLQSLGYTLIGHIVNVTLLKLTGLPVVPASVLILGGLEALIAWRAGRAWRSEGASATGPVFSSSERIGLLLVAAMVAGLGWSYRDYMVRELGHYWYAAEVMGENVEAGGMNLEAAGVSLVRSGTWERVSAGDRDLFRLSGVSGPVELTLRATTVTRVPLRYLWEGPVGSRLTLDCEDARRSVEIERAPIEVAEEGPTLRYLDRGIILVSLPLTVREERACTLTPEMPSVAGALPEAGGNSQAENRLEAGGTRQAAGPLETGGLPEEAGTLVDLTGWPLEALPEPEALSGWTLSHYYQILNIAENVEWARRTLVDQWVTINQPPLWSYVYSAVVLHVGNGLWAVNLFFLLLVGLTVVVAVKAAAAEQGEVDWPFWMPLILLGVSHARIIIGSGSTNFPDNLYAFSLIAGLCLLLKGRAAGFAGAGLSASFLRYPGSTLAVILSGLSFLFYPGRRRTVLRAGLWFMLAIALLCLGFLIAATVSGQLEHWLEVLYFETFPEHFHDQYELPVLLQRPPEFYGLLMRYAGYTPVLLLGMKGRLAKLVTLWAVIYTFFLCFIDHFPSHYFVPLLYMVGVAVTATITAWQGWRRWTGWGLACAGLIYALLQPV